MPEFFLELFSEEIPARMQANAAVQLSILISGYLAEIIPRGAEGMRYWGARRIAFSTQVQSKVNAVHSEQLGPRLNAPDQAIDGFLRKNKATRDQLTCNETHYLLSTTSAERPAFDVILEKLPEILLKFPWPKSMRWGQSGDFNWVRPLRRITCLLDGDVVPIVFGPITASNETEGHRFMAPDPVTVASAEDWERKLGERHVIVNADDRRQMILKDLSAQAASRRLTLVEDENLLDEVRGLVEWPVPLIGRIDPQFMALPPEVRELSMKVNQRYFALRGQTGKPAPFFAFVANIEAEDGGRAIIAGNERVLRARLADAEHFWNQDRKHLLVDYLPKLKGVTFHAKLGTQYERAERIAALSRQIADLLGADGSEAQQAEWAGRLCKADLVTGMVGEFPELQGIMGGYYAENPLAGAAIRTHYQPKGPGDEVPEGLVACAVALADKLDTLREFFRIGERPTGSGDPYALRRAALGVIRIIRENGLSLRLRQLCGGDADLFGFLIERLRVLLRSEGERYDVLDAIFASGADDDIISLLNKMNAVAVFLATEDGANLLTAYRRAANILKIENAKDGPHTGAPDPALAASGEERGLTQALDMVAQAVRDHLAAQNFFQALHDLANLRGPVDLFFEAVKINADDPALRKNRLKLLAKLRDIMHTIADFSKIEG
jgi:glycyl-tRNA synthetase beta chain